MNRAIGAHGLKPVVDRVFGFDDFRDTYALMGSGEAVGKIVIRL
jgi:NADPH:quinone reductase-like Zn-dependent oxidoreductase